MVIVIAEISYSNKTSCIEVLPEGWAGHISLRIPDFMTFISRRDLLKRAGVAAASGTLARGMAVSARTAALQSRREPLETLTAVEADLLDAVVARLIPSDANGPGAREAGAVRYIDRALGGALASSREVYGSGLAALEEYSRSSRGKRFLELPPAEQDSVLRDIESGAATGFIGGASAFFALVLSHTHQGTFGDPYYGGNANFVGWDLLRYPGVRTVVPVLDQRRLENGELKPNHRSAYESGSFSRASAAGSPGHREHGD
jgi:gluconate 2-dehydrogenase gamma chain